MGFCYTKNMVVNPRDVQILGENDSMFWRHHGRKEEEKDYLRQLAHILPDAIDKYQTGQQLTEDEEYAYDIFVAHGPQLEYDCINQQFNVIDGRHRMYMLREEGIQLEMRVGCYDISQQEKDRLQEQATTDREDSSRNYFTELFDTIKGCFDVIVGRNDSIDKKTQIEHEGVEKETIVTKMAIVDNEINRSLIGILDADVYRTNDEIHLIVEGQNLDGAQELFKEGDVVILEEREL